MKAQQHQNAIMMQRINRQQNSGVMILNSYADYLSGFTVCICTLYLNRA